MPRSRIIFSLICVLMCVCAHAQDISQQKEKRSRIERDIEILRSQISSNESQSSQALATISLIQAQKKSRQELLKESDREIAAIDRQIGTIRDQVRQKERVLDTLKTHYSRLVLGAYKNRDIKLWYMYILASENMSQAFRRFGYFKNLSSQIQASAKKVEEAKAELDARRKELSAQRQKADNLRKERQKEVDRLKADETKQQNLVNKLKKNNKTFQASLKSKQAEMKAIDKQIEKMLAEATGGTSKTGAKKPAQQVDYVLDKNFENNKGKLPWPVDGPVTEHYGAYKNKELKLSLFNNGIHIACEKDSPVRAVFDGVVSNVMLAPGYGQCVLIQHGSYYSSYCKVKNATVRQGDKVTTGQIIGEVSTIMGKTQLYFLIYKKKYQDPEAWLRSR